jgi:sulfur-oxidizing protein SoxB
VRVGGLQYACEPGAAMGKRISALTLRGKPVEADRKYRVAGWAPVSEQARSEGGEAIWDVMERYLRRKKIVRPQVPAMPLLRGVAGNAGLA